MAAKTARTKNVESRTTKETVPKPSRLLKWLPWIFIVCGVIGTFASAAITIEKITLLQHPGSSFICDLNPVISCGNVMESKQANAFGFMNTLIGLIGFPIVITIGAAMLAGAKFRRWFWFGMLAGLSLGMVFAYWLLFQSMYRIGALCPYCLSVDIALTTAWWYLVLYLFGRGYGRLSAQWQKIGNFARRHHLDILIFWFVLVTALILHRFWYYFGPHWFHMN
ncbi:vitamin K epoxide reductase family protein [Candidatus Saccharibacteria bacterium]|nr:MAG: vitamin K epoxide reductase family protein [Candidatus Saccharibacteria bacterium]